MTKKFTYFVLATALLLFSNFSYAQQKRIYIAYDDHTDYVWSSTELQYRDDFLEMLDNWMDYNDATKIAQPLNPQYWSKWNTDGALWVKIYKENRTPAQFQRLITQIKDGQIMVPFSPLVNTYGATPAEAVLRGMYYAGSLERAEGLKLEMATSVENQTLPLGLASLWKGAGAKYAWHGVCNCDTEISDFNNRDKEIYWYKGQDTNKVLLKWYSMVTNNGFPSTNLGGYGEMRQEQSSIDALIAKKDPIKYNYDISGGFGYGHDDKKTLSFPNLINLAIANSTNPAAQQVIVSNEVDFFKDFETNYGAALPNVTQTFGNEWDLNCASIAALSAKIKRSLEKLRVAEAMSAIVTNYKPNFAASLNKEEAWMALGLYWEHSMGFSNGSVNIGTRTDFQRRLETTFSTYVNDLFDLAKLNLADLITNSSGKQRFFVFNPLGWQRTDYADFEYTAGTNIHITDVTTNTEVPFQFITKNGTQHIRVEAANIPSIGYRIFQIEDGIGSAVFNDIPSNANQIVQNKFFAVTYTNQGVITSIIDKQNGNKEIVKLIDGKYVNDLGTGAVNSPTGTITIENIGTTSITVRTNTSDGPLVHNTKITLFRNIPRIEIDNQITQGFEATNTWSYSFDITTPEVMHEEVGAVVKAKMVNNPTNPGAYATKNARYDWLTLNHFATVNETGGGYGISLSNQDCYFMKLGNSNKLILDEVSSQINVLVGGRVAAVNPLPTSAIGFPNQGGDTEFNQRFAITTHANYNAANDAKRALEHQSPFVTSSVTNPVNFLLPELYSFVSVNDPNAVIWAIKPAEDGSIDKGIVTRVWNMSNTGTTPTFSYNLIINQAKRTTHIETDLNDALFPNLKDLSIGLGSHEMKTFRVKLNVIALPVKLLSFTGEKKGSINQLQWKATAEINLQQYILERSTDGGIFTPITSVNAKSGLVNNYNFSDANINNATTYYYRLKIINDNQSFSYSNIILLQPAKSFFDLLVYPNPVSEQLKINLLLEKQTRCTVMLLDAKGALVKTAASPLFEKGYNYYTLSVSELPFGDYKLVITAGDKKFVKSFVKQ